MAEKHITYTPSGICARSISVTIEDDVVTDIAFVNGCDGNHKGLVALCIGRKASEIRDLLRGITCGSRRTSCPDQLSIAIDSMLA